MSEFDVTLLVPPEVKKSAQLKLQEKMCLTPQYERGP